MIWIIMPVYNTSAYLDEAIQSVTAQDYSFEENIILHLIDDASTDNSWQICEKYKKQYPWNIEVTHFDSNRGVSEARNFAVRKCLEMQKENPDLMVVFMDSDDRLDKSYISEVVKYMKMHPDIHIATARMEYFGALQGECRLNYRFHERELVEIKKDFNCPQYYIGGVILRGKALQRIHFKEGMTFWEDALAVNKVILREGRYGLIENAKYYYRKREDGSSLADRAWNSYREYGSIVYNAYLPLIYYSLRYRGRVTKYIQFVVGYHLRRFLSPERSQLAGTELTDKEKKDFLRKLRFVLRFIRPSIITKIPTTLPIIEEMLSVKRGKRIRIPRTYTEDDCLYIYKGYVIGRMSERRVRLFYKIGEADESVFSLSQIPNKEQYRGMWRGRFATPLYEMKEEDYIFAERRGERIRSLRIPCKKKIKIFDDQLRNYRYSGFVIAIPEEWESARFGICMEGHEIFLNTVVFSDVCENRKEEKTDY